jgi:Flp pilus assembly protein TadD
LAEAEYDAGDYSAAEAAADRALAAEPRNVHAMIYKGRARMALAKASGGKSDWKEIRSWFSRANKLDTENAEPLMLFFQSYLEAGEQPTKNAVDALLYSVVLAPQDHGLRINAVRQLLIDNRVADARKLFAPLAFQPHASDKYRESNAKIMGAIDANDGKAALTILDAAMRGAAEEPEVR